MKRTETKIVYSIWDTQNEDLSLGTMLYDKEADAIEAARDLNHACCPLVENWYGEMEYEDPEPQVYVPVKLRVEFIEY